MWVILIYGTFVLGGLALYFLLPTTGRSTKTAGAIFGLAALAGAMVLCGSRFLSASGANAFFYLSATVAIAASVLMVISEKPVYSALYFVLVILSITPLLLLQQAEFLAIALVIIYAGAILVTYVFVIMLLQQSGPSVYDRRSRSPLIAVLAGFTSMALVAGQMAVLPEKWAIQGTLVASDSTDTADAMTGGASNIEMIGRAMISRYVVALEIAGVLLLVAMIGAIVVSRKKVPAEGPGLGGQPLGQTGREVPPF